MNSRLTIKELAAVLTVPTGREKEELTAFLREWAALVSVKLEEDGRVEIPGLGCLEKPHPEEPDREIRFVPDPEFRERVNKPFSFFEPVELDEGIEFPDLEKPESEPLPVPEAVDDVEDKKPLIQEKTPDIPAEIPGPSEETTDVLEKKPDSPVEEPKPVYETEQAKPPYRLWKALAFLVVAMLVAGYWYVEQGPVDFPVEVEQEEVAEIPSSPRTESPDSLSLPVDTLVQPADQDSLPDEKPAPEPVAREIGKDTIAKGDRLTQISLKYYGHKIFWVYLYDYNKQVISDPNNVPIGTEIRIPSPDLYGIDAKDATSREKAARLQSQLLSGRE